MATVRITGRQVLDCRGIIGIETVLLPGYNLDVPDTAYEIFKTHPTLKYLLESDEVEFIQSEPEVKGEVLDVLVADNKKTHEPSPIILADDREAIGKTPKAKRV